MDFNFEAFLASFEVLGVSSGYKLSWGESRKGPYKRFQHLTNIRSTKVERMLGKC